jgi:RimJ/RimL family protein N-acetyltransferase
VTALLAPPKNVVRLRPLRMSDAPRVRRWMASIDVIRFTVVVPSPEHGPVEPYAEVDADRYLEALVRDPRRRSYAIELDGVHVGNVGLKDYEPGAEEAECFIEVGEAFARGIGVGTRAMIALIDHCFDVLRLSRVRLGVFEFNDPALKMYTRLGFLEDGLYGSHHADGRTWKVLAMSLGVAHWQQLRSFVVR